MKLECTLNIDLRPFLKIDGQFLLNYNQTLNNNLVALKAFATIDYLPSTKVSIPCGIVAFIIHRN
jgi:hypothetical protein